MSVNFSNKVLNMLLSDPIPDYAKTYIVYNYNEKNIEKSERSLTSVKLVDTDDMLNIFLTMNKLLLEIPKVNRDIFKENIENIIKNLITRNSKYKDIILDHIEKVKKITENENINKLKLTLESDYIHNSILLIILIYFYFIISEFRIKNSTITLEFEKV